MERNRKKKIDLSINDDVHEMMSLLETIDVKDYS